MIGPSAPIRGIRKTRPAMHQHKSETERAADLHSLVNALLLGCCKVYLSVSKDEFDLVMRYQGGDELHPVAVRDRWTIERRFVRRDVLIAFQVAEDWYLVPHDELVASVEGDLDFTGWAATGVHARARPGRAMLMPCERHRLTHKRPSEPLYDDGDERERPRNAALIASYRSVLERPGYEGGRWVPTTKNDDGTVTLAMFDLDEEMRSFVEACRASGWLGQAYDDRSVAVVNSETPSRVDLSGFDLVDIAKVTTFVSRAEGHTTGGAYTAALRSGLLAKVARQAAAIVERRGTGRPSRAERIAGAMLGGAIGDALGTCTKGLTPAKVLAEFGPDGLTGYAPRYERLGAVTSVTQMTLFTAEGLVRAFQSDVPSPRELRKRLHAAQLTWLLTQQRRPRSGGVNWEVGSDLLHNPALNEVRAPGKTVMASLVGARALGGWHTADNDSKGCSCVVRGGPIGMMGQAIGGPDEVFDVAAGDAGLTHGHASARLASGFFAVLVDQLCRGMDLWKAIGFAHDETARRPDSKQVTGALKRLRDLMLRTSEDGMHPTSEDLRALGKAHEAEGALAIGLCCAMVAEDFAEAVLMAANHSGDGRNAAAIAGMAYGAWKGTDAIPLWCLADLELREVIASTADLMEGAISNSLRMVLNGEEAYEEMITDEDDRSAAAAIVAEQVAEGMAPETAVALFAPDYPEVAAKWLGSHAR